MVLGTHQSLTVAAGIIDDPVEQRSTESGSRYAQFTSRTRFTGHCYRQTQLMNCSTAAFTRSQRGATPAHFTQHSTHYTVTTVDYSRAPAPRTARTSSRRSLSQGQDASERSPRRQRTRATPDLSTPVNEAEVRTSIFVGPPRYVRQNFNI